MNNTIDINCELQPINGIQLNFNIVLSGFNFYYKGITYIVTVHHGLPINNSFLKEQKLTLIHNCIWNELLILSTESFSADNINKKHKYKIPNKEELYIKNKNNIITIMNKDPVFIQLHEIPTNPPTIYLNCDIISGDVEESMSGSPVFDKNNYLVGILSKKNDLERSVYIIPIYILIKTLIKKNNNAIFDIDYNDEIKKINGSPIKNCMILHKLLNISIPIPTYLMIEGDDDEEIKINKQIIVKYYNINDELHISNASNLIFKNNKYELSIRFLKLIKLYFSDIVPKIFEYIQQNYKYKMYIYINKKRIVIDNMIEFNTNIDDIPLNLKVMFDTTLK